jgi:hypothetical protein
MIDRNKIASEAADDEHPWRFIQAEATRLGLKGPQWRDFRREMQELVRMELRERWSHRREALYGGEKPA